MLSPGDGYPTHVEILSTAKVSEQTATNWCGPTSTQMIHWNWGANAFRAQSFWASELGTGPAGGAGTAIPAMVREVNEWTGWYGPAYAGQYVVLNIGGYTFDQWYSLNVRHYYAYHAPVVLHPLLSKEFFPYLDDNGSGHFQVGRGYHLNTDTADQIGYFEPWNQQRFDPSERFIARVQWRNAILSYRANLAHSLHNIGV